MIFVHHSPLIFDCKLGLGLVAVTLFFMLSGFLSTISYYDRVLSTSFDYRKYVMGKAIKFYPLHWLFIIVSISLTLNGLSNLPQYLGKLFINASLLQSVIPLREVYFSFNSVSWFLSDTLIFVAIFPFVLRFLVRTDSKNIVSIGIAILTVYFLLWFLLPKEYTHNVFYVNPLLRMIDFSMGIICGLVFQRLRNDMSVNAFVSRYKGILQIFAIVILILLFVISTFNSDVSFHSIIYIPLAFLFLILVGINGGGIFSIVALQRLGSISYAFFLSHQLLIRYTSKVCNALNVNMNLAVVALCLCLTIIISYILTSFFDKYMNLWLKNKINQQSMTAR